MKKVKFLNGFLMLIAALCFSSCFDILEEFEFNADGSGKARMQIDMSKMMEMMAGLAALDSTGEGEKGMDEIFTNNSSVASLQQIPGIKNVQSLNDKEKGIVGFSYEFENLEALNNAISATSNSMDLAGFGLSNPEQSDEQIEQSEDGENYFVRKGNKFSRVIKTPKKEEEKETDPNDEMMRQMFADGKYEVRYSFAEGVKKVKKNKSATLGPDGKTVSIVMPLLDLMDSKVNPAVDVTLK